MKYAEFPGILQLEGQIQSLIKSSEKELSGFVSVFLKSSSQTNSEWFGSPCPRDPSALKQHDGLDESLGTLGGKLE